LVLSKASELIRKKNMKMENHAHKNTTKKNQGFLSADTVLRFIPHYNPNLSITLKTFFLSKIIIMVVVVKPKHIKLI